MIWIISSNRTFHFWNYGDIWYPSICSVICIYCEYLMESITSHICTGNTWWMVVLPSVDSAVTNYGSLMTVTRDIWLELSLITSKQHWLISHPRSMQKIPRCISGKSILCPLVSMGYGCRRPTRMPLLTPWHWTMSHLDLWCHWFNSDLGLAVYSIVCWVLVKAHVRV